MHCDWVCCFSFLMQKYVRARVSGTQLVCVCMRVHACVRVCMCIWCNTFRSVVFFVCLAWWPLTFWSSTECVEPEYEVPGAYGLRHASTYSNLWPLTFTPLWPLTSRPVDQTRWCLVLQNKVLAVLNALDEAQYLISQNATHLISQVNHQILLLTLPSYSLAQMNVDLPSPPLPYRRQSSTRTSSLATSSST